MWACLIMGGLLVSLAGLSFRDAYRCSVSGKAGDVALQLPDAIKRRIHSIMRKGLKTGSLILAGFGLGMVTTALESVCTGQVLLPALVIVAKAGQADSWAAWRLILLYNGMSIVPLISIFLVVYAGLRVESLIAWSRQNVITSKILLGCLFLLLAMIIVLN